MITSQPYLSRAFATFSSCFRERSLQQKILNRVLRPRVKMTKEEKEARPAIKMWLSHWNNCKKTVSELKDFQDRIMETVQVEGTKQNSLKFNEINEWYFHNPAATEVKIPTLLIHGYAASSMAYYRTFSGLSAKIRDLYAIDLPSNGLSPEVPLEMDAEKPLPLKLIYLDNDKFKVPYVIDSLHSKFVIQQVEDYYLDRIDRWRKENNIEKFNLVGHSFGGYLSFKYAIKYPQSVDTLCLISPLGVESNAFSVNNNLCSNTSYDFDYEDYTSKFYSKKRLIPSVIFKNQSDILRWMGPVGAKLCWKYIMASYSRVPTMEYKEYVFELLYGKGGIPLTARKTFTELFTRNLLARDPIMDSLKDLHAKKVLLVYGSHDWMNKNAGASMVKTLNLLRRDKSAGYVEIPEAGHNLFLDNPDVFNSSLLEFLKK